MTVRRGAAVVIRSPRAGSESLMKEVGQAVWSVDSNLPLANVHTLDYYTKRSMARTSFTLVMLALAGGMALAPRHRRALRRDRLLGVASGPARSAFAWHSARRKKS